MESSSKANRLLVPVSLNSSTTKRRSRFLNFKWGIGDELVLFASKTRKEFVQENETERIHTQSFIAKEEAGLSMNIVSFSWDQIPSEFRSLVKAGHKTFVDIQESMNGIAQYEVEAYKKRRGKHVLLEASQSLRRALDISISRLTKRIDSSRKSEIHNELVGFLERSKHARMLWQVCEILALKADTILTIPLVCWVYEHFPRFDANEEDAMFMDVQERGSESSHFWTVIYASVLRGDTLSAWCLLRNHSKFNALSRTEEKNNNDLVECFHDIKDALLSMPRLRSAESDGQVVDRKAIMKLHIDRGFLVNGELLGIWENGEIDAERFIEFKSKWTIWNRTVNQIFKKYTSLMNIDFNLKQLVNILRGDVETIMAVLEGPYDSWAHVFAASLLYSVPFSTRAEYSRLIESCMEFNCDERTKNVILSVFQGDFVKSLQLLYSNSGDKWICAHLAEILAYAEVVESISIETSKPLDEEYFSKSDFILPGHELDIREFFLLDYAVHLGLGGYQAHRRAHSSMNWRLSVDYLAILNRPMKRSPFVHISSFFLPLGRKYAELILGKQYPINDKYVSKLVYGCNRMMLEDLSNSMQRQRALHWWCSKGGRAKFLSGSEKNGFVGCVNGLLWAYQVGPSYVQSLLKLLYEKGSEASLKSFMKSIKGTFELSPTGDAFSDRVFYFLREYPKVLLYTSQASNCLDENHFEDAWAKRDLAIKLYSNIVRKEQIPLRFRVFALRDLLLWQLEGKHADLVVLNPPLISAADCEVLMESLEYIEVSLEADAIIKSFTPKAELTAMRLILTQCLSRSVIMTGVYSKELQNP